MWFFQPPICFFFFFFLALLLCGIQDLSSPDRDGIHYTLQWMLEVLISGSSVKSPSHCLLNRSLKVQVQTLFCVQLAVSWGIAFGSQLPPWTVWSFLPLAEEKVIQGLGQEWIRVWPSSGCCSFQGFSILIWNREHHCLAFCLLKALGLGLEGVSYHLSQSTSF